MSKSDTSISNNQLTIWLCILNSDQLRLTTMHNQLHGSSQYKSFSAAVKKKIFYSTFCDNN